MKTATNLAIKYVPLTDIKAYKNNVKKHPQTQIDSIKYSIERFGMCDPIAIDSAGVIIEGHGRFEALKQLGATNAPVLILGDLTPDEANIYRLAHNSITMSTGIDVEQLYRELDAIGGDFDLNALELPMDIEGTIRLFDEIPKNEHSGAKKKEIMCPLCGGKFLK